MPSQVADPVVQVVDRDEQDVGLLRTAGYTVVTAEGNT